MSSPEKVMLVIHGWNSQCGACGYGGKSWADSPAREGKPVLTPDSRECPECGARFTHKQSVYDREPEEIT
jgi:ribosomal protein S27AE